MTAASEPVPELNRSQAHSPVARAALSGAAIATVGVVFLLIGYAAKWKGYGNDGTDSNTALSDVFFFLFSLGGTVAVVCAIVSLVRNRRLGWIADRVAGLRVLIGFVVAIVAIAVVDAIF